MSRIGKRPISVPKGVEIKMTEENYVTVKGPKGVLEQQLPVAMAFERENDVVTVVRPSDNREHRSLGVCEGGGHRARQLRTAQRQALHR